MNISGPDYFAEVPNEILIVIYGFTWESYPMLRKVNRRWRKLLESIVIPNGGRDHMLNLASAQGFKVQYGELTDNNIMSYCQRGYYDLLMRANYSWQDFGCMELSAAYGYVWHNLRDGYEDEQHDALHEKFSSRPDENPSKCNFITELFNIIVSKCTYHGPNFAEEIIHEIYDIDLIETAHTAGVSFSRIKLESLYSHFQMEKLYDLGYFRAENAVGVVKNLIDTIIKSADYSSYGFTPRGEYKMFFEHIVGCGQIITDDDIVYAANTKCDYVVQMMRELGYIRAEST